MGVGSSRGASAGAVDAPFGINLDSFEYIDETDFGMMAIGKGGFGLVTVMRLKPVKPANSSPRSKGKENELSEDQLFAIKAMNKAKLLARDQVENTLNELKILTRLSRHHPNIVNLHYAFQDSRCLYAVLDLCLGGSLAHALANAPNQRFPLPKAKHYTAELIVGLRYLHSERIAHRDIKPDNLLIDINGRLRISDFNVSLKVPLGKAGSELPHQDGWGTRGYRAPEIYIRKGAGRLFSCDWWSTGATLFEMLTGEIPYPIRDGEAPVDMLRRVYAGDLDVDRLGAEEDLRQFVRGLLMFEPRDRLDDDSVLTHPFMRDVDFAKLERGDTKPPWIPLEEVNHSSLTDPANMSSSKQRERAKHRLDLLAFAKNFDVKLDERERLRVLNNNLGAFGFDRLDGGAAGAQGDEDENEFELENTVCVPAQQQLFSFWSFNINAPEQSPLGLRQDPNGSDESDRLPKFALLQSVSALQTPDQVRGFVMRTDDTTLQALMHEMKLVYESLLAENAKFIQAEMRCDDLSRELVRERTAKSQLLQQQQQQQQNASGASSRAEGGATRAETVEFVEEEEISEI